MKFGKILEIVKENNIVIPMYLYKMFPKLEINLETFLFLMYLNGKGQFLIFDIKRLSEEFCCDIKKVMEYISILQDKKLIELKVVKDDKNIIEEYISLDLFYEKVSINIIEEINNEKEDTTNIFEILESELGKQLSPIEYEIVKAWKNSNYSDEIIKEAIKEAVYNGVANLRYIAKILYEWAKKNIKTRT